MAAKKNTPNPLDSYNMAVSGSSAADTPLRVVVDDGWTTSTHSISVSRSDPLPRSHLISQSRQRTAIFNQAPLPPVTQWFSHSHHQDFPPSSPPSFPNSYPIQPFSGHFEPHHDDVQAESLRRMPSDDNRTPTHFRQPIPSFHPGPSSQLTPLRSQYDPYPAPEYGGYMVQHPNPYVEYPVGFDIYGNVSGPSLYIGHLTGNLASNNRYPLQPVHPGSGTEVHQHPGFPFDFGQRQYYYPAPPSIALSSQIPRHLPISPLIPGPSTPYLGNFDQQVRHG